MIFYRVTMRALFHKPISQNLFFMKTHRLFSYPFLLILICLTFQVLAQGWRDPADEPKRPVIFPDPSPDLEKVFLSESEIAANPDRIGNQAYQFDYELLGYYKSDRGAAKVRMYVNSADGSVGMDEAMISEMVAQIPQVAAYRDRFKAHYFIWLVNQQPGYFFELPGGIKMTITNDPGANAADAMISGYLENLWFLDSFRDPVLIKSQGVEEPVDYVEHKCVPYYGETDNRKIAKVWMGVSYLVSQAPHWNSGLGIFKNYENKTNYLIGRMVFSGGGEAEIISLNKLTSPKTLRPTGFNTITPTMINGDDYMLIIKEIENAKQALAECKKMAKTQAEKQVCEEKIMGPLKAKYPLFFGRD